MESPPDPEEAFRRGRDAGDAERAARSQREAAEAARLAERGDRQQQFAAARHRQAQSVLPLVERFCEAMISIDCPGSMNVTEFSTSRDLSVRRGLRKVPLRCWRMPGAVAQSGGSEPNPLYLYVDQFARFWVGEFLTAGTTEVMWARGQWELGISTTVGRGGPSAYPPELLLEAESLIPETLGRLAGVNSLRL